MYSVEVKIKGLSPLLQHRYPLPEFETLSSGGKKKTGETNYSQEWRQYLYVNGEDEIYQPAIHIEAAMVKAAVNFKIQGKRGKSYKDLFAGNVFVSPEEILHGVKEPEALDADADKRLYLDMRPVVVSRARVVRLRPAFKAGWTLEFQVEVLDDQIPQNVLHDVLALAGKTVGIGDFRPRFGRFAVTRFEEM